MRIRAAGLAVVSLSMFVLTACWGSNGGGRTSGCPGGTPRCPAPGSERFLVRQSDLPADYRPELDLSADLDGRQIAAQLQRCTGVTVPRRAEHQRGNAFAAGKFEAHSSVTDVSTGFVAPAAMQLLAAPKARECFGAALTTTFAADGRSGPRSVIVRVVAGGTSRIVGTMSGELTFVDAGTTTHVYLDAFYLATRNHLVLVTFTGIGRRPDHAVAKRVIAAVSKRVTRG